MNGKFIGKSSMGFITGKTYEIESKKQLVRKGTFPFYKYMVCICIYDKNGSACCPYQNLESVMDNWEFYK